MIGSRFEILLFFKFIDLSFSISKCSSASIFDIRLYERSSFINEVNDTCYICLRDELRLTHGQYKDFDLKVLHYVFSIISAFLSTILKRFPSSYLALTIVTMAMAIMTITINSLLSSIQPYRSEQVVLLQRISIISHYVRTILMSFSLSIQVVTILQVCYLVFH